MARRLTFMTDLVAGDPATARWSQAEITPPLVTDLSAFCSQHPKSRVWFDGTYDAVGRKRQRLHGVDGGHVVTKPLPRQPPE